MLVFRVMRQGEASRVEGVAEEGRELKRAPGLPAFIEPKKDGWGEGGNGRVGASETHILNGRRDTERSVEEEVKNPVVKRSAH